MNNGKKLNSILVACSLVFWALPAAFAGPDGDKHFKMMDTDGDGKISRAEHAAAAKQMFDQCDANHDGIATAAEMDAATARKGETPAKDDKTAAEKIQMIDQKVMESSRPPSTPPAAKRCSRKWTRTATASSAKPSATTA